MGAPSRARECTGSGADGGHRIHHEDAKGAKGKAKRFRRTGAACRRGIPIFGAVAWRAVIGLAGMGAQGDALG